MPDQSVAWLFPGQGAQETGMGRDVYEGSPAARRVFEAADETLGYSISQICFEGPDERLQDTQFAQPALFTTSIACLEAAREVGGLLDEGPAFVAGHSLGEYTALVAANALDFVDGLLLVQERGRLMSQAAQQQPGAMAALLGLDEDKVSELCREVGAEVCNINAPGQIVIGGTPEAVDAAMALALERGAQRGVKLRVSGAFHTSLMQPAAEGMAVAVAGTPMRDPRVPIIANTTAEPITTAQVLREELVQQLVHSVQWLRTVQYLREHGVDSVIEFGPGRVLTGLTKRIDRGFAVHNVSDIASARSASAIPAPP
jgi:[acyl-carrier-protein] S-malonyltransferase